MGEKVVGVLVVVAMGAALVIALAKHEADASLRDPAPLAEWGDWRPVHVIDGTEEARVFGLANVGPPLQFGDALELCSSTSVWDCSDDKPRWRQSRPEPWVRAQIVVDRLVREGDTLGFHPMPMLPGTTLWARVRAVDAREVRVRMRLIYGGAYGWSEPEETWEVELVERGK